MMHNKTCSKCKEEKILSAFCKVIRNKDSLNSRCRECERILYNKNRESLLERSRIYRNNNKELLSKLDLTSEEDCRRGFHYRNLQPMWHTDNLKKSNKII